jgi:hypothetical protein
MMEASKFPTTEEGADWLGSPAGLLLEFQPDEL